MWIRREYGQFVVVSHKYLDNGALLFCMNSNGEDVRIAQFERLGDAITAAKLFQVHVNEKVLV